MRPTSPTTSSRHCTISPCPPAKLPNRTRMAADYKAVTSGIQVTVRTLFLEDQSNPDEGKWVWAYQVRIQNQGRETVQLMRRTWRITDAHGRMQVVQGDGVVGEQPVLEP